ncbi:MAG: CinA family nicotinamide mononucleotide deamidase-related protein [Trueperaceae bacterium]|nr:MAG: CinA family nicotinamide mononucleotide deamidase-related protein [Trueperaceae bacterium]
MPTIRNAELLSIGTELLLGEIVDTNSAWLATQLAERSVDVFWSQRVGDNLERIVHAITQALERSDMLVVCGGLGPTDDDMTREAIASVLDESLIVNPTLEHELRERFSRFARHMPEQNLKQAWLIPSAEALANPLGTAPGWLVRTNRAGRERFIIALPGPPRELKRMWQQEVLPRLTLPESTFYVRQYKTQEIGESGVAEALQDLTKARNPTVATYARRDGVHIRVAAKAESEAEARDLAAPAERAVEERLKPHIWGTDEDELAPLVIEMLKVKGKSLASFEAASGGRLSKTLSDVPNANSVYRGGVVAWSTGTMQALGVPSAEQMRPGNATREMTIAMAKAACHLFGSELGIATNIPGHGAVSQQGDDQALIALEICEESVVKELSLPHADQPWRRERLTYAALFLLWRQLQ